jgi:hypothetical protein
VAGAAPAAAAGHPRLGRGADDIVRPPKGTTHVVLDTPAGLHGKRLDAVMRIADRMLIPLQPSLFDIQATHAFVQELRAHRRGHEVKLGLVGMRVREHTLPTNSCTTTWPRCRCRWWAGCATRRTTCSWPRAA